MAGKVEIFRQALSRIGSSKFIGHPNEQSLEARTCNEFYDSKLRLTLCQYDWSFARKRKSLALIEQMEGQAYLFRYAMPSDCVMVRFIEPATRNVPNEALVVWELESDTDTKRTTILTDQPEAKLVYTTDTIPEAFFPEHFVDLLAWNLASEIAMPVVKKPEVMQACVNAARVALLYARTAQLNEGQPDQPVESEFIRARD